jgi:hypothetical protein
MLEEDICKNMGEGASHVDVEVEFLGDIDSEMRSLVFHSWKMN